jgi:hypothetical protein
MLKAAIHCHSTYSDGEFTLSELRQVFQDAGYRAVFMTDHAESFDPDKLAAYIDECESLSDEQFRFVPGLEYECERRMHILGFGATSLVSSKLPQDVIRHIENQNCVSVIAHPGDSMFSWIESFDILPTGIETWNTKYDGRYAPRPRTFRLLNRLQQRKPEMKAYYGQDLHWKNQYRGLSNSLDCEKLTQTLLLAALRSGNYSGICEQVELPSNGILTDPLLTDFEKASNRYMRKQRLFKRVKKMSGDLGKNLPAPVKSRIRKIFS